jgi:pimeloyl-ACP methyl ester carboxylesterase
MHHAPFTPKTSRRLRVTRGLALGVTGLTALVGLAPSPAQAEPASKPTAVQIVDGTLPDGSKYQIRMPKKWNGTLALFAHGLRLPIDDNPVEVAPDPEVGNYLLQHGVALAGSDFGSTGWAVEDAIRDQLATRTAVTNRFGKPARTIAWGVSMGGQVSTALAERYPGQISGALPISGAEAGAVGGWNHFLDGAFVFDTLLGAGTPLQVIGIDDPGKNIDTAAALLQDGVSTAAGRARLALVAAVLQLPGGFGADGPVNGPTTEDRFRARMEWLNAPYLQVAFGVRADVERRAGGNPSNNIGVDYADLLAKSGQRSDVEAIYAGSGLSLKDDLKTLAKAPRIPEDHDARFYLENNVSFTGRFTRPVLTIHNVADGALPTSQEQALRTAVHEQGRDAFLRQEFVNRPGHGIFTPAETIAAFGVLTTRVQTGHWPSTTPAAMNLRAKLLGPALNTGGGTPVPPAYVAHQPRPFPRTFVVH